MADVASRGAGRVGLALVLILALPHRTAALELELPSIFGDHMVLQSELGAPVWGKAAPGQEVRVQLGEARAMSVADALGHWSVRFEGLAPGGPFRLDVQAERTLVLEDVLVGEVWLGGGQSNMEMAVKHCQGLDEVLRAADLPALRFFVGHSLPAEQPLWKGAGRWIVCSPEAVPDLSATLFHFGCELHARLARPIGLIDASLGGSAIESWIRREVQLAHPELRASAEARIEEHASFDVEAYLKEYRERRKAWTVAVAQALEQGLEPPPRELSRAEVHQRLGTVGQLFNAKIAPLVPFGLRGVLWYQGEANHLEPWLYRFQLPLLVGDWRALFGREDLSFAWVQLAGYEPGITWPIVREAQRRALSIPGTGMAVAIDLGEAQEIHPPNKRDVGLRLAAWALGEVYGLDVATSGPLYETHEFEGHELRVRFRHAEGGLVARGGELVGFEIAGPLGIWRPAKARIEGEQVIVSAPPIARPHALRYGWAADPRCNLYGANGLPASPFTTVERYWLPLGAAGEDE